MSQQIRQLEAELGRVAIGFIGSATCALLPKLVRHLRATLPDIDFEAHPLADPAV